MQKTVALIRGGFESSSVKTQEFLAFSRVFKKEFKAELDKKYIVTAIEFNVGHFYISGFFQLEDERIFYFSISDVRHFAGDSMLIRTARDFKDFSGGMNNYVKMSKGMFEDYNLPR